MKIINDLKEWDEGNFSLDSKISESETEEVLKKSSTHEWTHEHIGKIGSTEKSTLNRLYPILTFLLVAGLTILLFKVVYYMPAFGSADAPANVSETIRRYIENGLSETGAINIVASVILDYRAFDTLGESHVLYTSAVVVCLLLIQRHKTEEDNETKKIMIEDEILRNTTKVLVPLILIFGIYVIFAGHLGPGGGFSGGSIIGAGLILYSVAYGSEKLEELITFKRYKIIITIALGFYSLAKCYSFYCGANHLETIFTNGTPGAIFSAGLILPLNIAVGIVVALTMYGFYSYFTRGRI